MYYSTENEIQNYTTYNHELRTENEHFFDYCSEIDDYYNIDPKNHDIILKIIDKWFKDESQKHDTKNNNLSKIESIVNDIALKQGCISVESFNDADGFFERFFIIRIPEDFSVTKRQDIFNKLIDEIIPICEQKGLIDLFMKTSIFLRR